MNEQKERKKTTKKIPATPSAKSVTAKPWVGSSGDQGEHELLHSAMASGHPKQVIDAMVNDAADCLAHLAHAHRNDGALAAGGQQFEACQNALRRGAQADLEWVGRRLDYGSVPYSIPYFCAAAATGSVELCELFLRHEAPLECRDSDHLGPLHFATLAGSLEVSKLLIEGGANLDASDNRLRTPLYFAAVTKNRDLSELLIRAGAQVMGRDAEKRSMLHMAVFVDALDVSELLIRSGASTEAIDGLRRTPLHYAAEKNAVALCQLLMEHGADVNALDKKRKTPLDLAAEAGAADVCRFFGTAKQGARLNEVLAPASRLPAPRGRSAKTRM